MNRTSRRLQSLFVPAAAAGMLDAFLALGQSNSMNRPAEAQGEISPSPPRQPQYQLRRSTPWLEGAQLDRNATARIRLHPAAADAGIAFARSDLPGRPTVRCAPENLQGMPRWTALAADGVWVHHTEHVLAALALCGIDNAIVEMDADRIPVVSDGTCAAFVAALQHAGRTPVDAPRRVYRLKGPAFLLDPQNPSPPAPNHAPLQNGRYVMGVPADGFAVSTVFHWTHREELPIGFAEYEHGAVAPDPQLLASRSYIVESEKAQMKDLLGPVQDNLMRLYPGCPTALSQEAARHKIVDFIGDLMVLGRPVQGRFVAVRAGHRIHHEWVRYLLANRLLELKEPA